jgi:thiamine pyrophosphate-dependent acetolactate synthase large subunit-like protein
MSTLGEPKAREKQQTAARLLIRSLVQQNVKYIFGIPGGKIMPTFDVLRDEGPQLIVCRHEQNAAFMAAAVGRLTGRPGVCLVTSGPGTGNLVTGVATATTEGDPMVAIGGIVPWRHSSFGGHPKANASINGLCGHHETGNKIQRRHQRAGSRR